jgi:putative peptidoglycan lipid II flippase
MKLLKNTLLVGFLTLLSRIVGYVRDIVIAYSLGATALNDAFIAALRLPNMFRSIFGEGAFNTAFIPIFSKILAKKGKEEAILFARTVQTILLICLLIFSICMMFLMPYIVGILTPGYLYDKEIFDIIVSLGRITFPYIIFISLMAFYGGISNTSGNYFAFASAPILMNVVLIIAPFFCDTPLMKIYALAYGLLTAGVLEMLWVMYFVSRSFGTLKFINPKLNKESKLLFKNIIPGIFGSGIAQINIFVSTTIASFVTGGISYLYYADRIYQLPLAVIGTALGTVLLPELSKNLASDRFNKVFFMQNKALEFASFFTLPATFILLLLANPIVKMLFQYGQFTEYSTLQTANALSIFTLGLPVYVVNKIFISLFFASGDNKTPVKISAFTLIINIGIGLMLLPFIKHLGVAVGSACAAWINMFLLIRILKKQKLFVLYKKIYIKLLKMLVASLTILPAVHYIKTYVHFNNSITELIISAIIGTITYLTLILVLRVYSVRSISLKIRSLLPY